MKVLSEAYLPYRVGGLMYCPADNCTVADKIVENKIPCLTSLCLCLEDSVSDERLPLAEQCLKRSLETLAVNKADKQAAPMLFVRIRTPEHLWRIYEENKGTVSVLTGFVLPKFELSNAHEYMSVFRKMEADGNFFYAMPTLESSVVADVTGRAERLLRLKEILDENKKYVLNIRVGGNDFAQLFGVRRSVTQNVYQIGVIQNILTDVINVFSRTYVVSGPVWEYFGQDENGAWAQGLKKEMELDILNGFIGKTAIHPTQLPVIFDGLKVSAADFEDAKRILSWNGAQGGVAKSADGGRMNEVKTHTKWAEKTYILGTLYGVKD